MLTKILFTLAVIVIVLFVFQAKFRGAVKQSSQAAVQAAAQRRVNKIAAYCVVGVLIVGGAGVFFYNWRTDNALITIRVMSGDSDSAATYQARRKDIKGRSFTTTDGRSVTLGDSDRVEYLEQ